MGRKTRPRMRARSRRMSRSSLKLVVSHERNHPRGYAQCTKAGRIPRYPPPWLCPFAGVTPQTQRIAPIIPHFVHIVEKILRQYSDGTGSRHLRPGLRSQGQVMRFSRPFGAHRSIFWCAPKLAGVRRRETRASPANMKPGCRDGACGATPRANKGVGELQTAKNSRFQRFFARLYIPSSIPLRSHTNYQAGRKKF